MEDYDLHIRSLEQIPADKAMLDAMELERYYRFIHPQKKIEFLKGRVFLKQTLQKYLAVEASKISLSISSRGRPFLPLIYGNKVPSFNLSHANGMIALGVSSNYQIGVDIESKTAIDPSKLKLFFSENEWSELGALTRNKIEKSLELFSMKEAFIKATDKKWSLNEISFFLQKGNWHLQKPLGEFHFYIHKNSCHLTVVCLNKG